MSDLSAFAELVPLEHGHCADNGVLRGERHSPDSDDVARTGSSYSRRASAKAARVKFVTIGYGDQAGYDRTDPAVRDAAHVHDDLLRQRGVDMGVTGPPVQVRNHDAAGVATQDGPFMSSPLPVAGFAVIEAPTLADAVELVSCTPCAVAHGVVEVWPLSDAP